MIRPSRVLAVAGHQSRLLSKDISVVIILLLMPLVLMAFLANGIQPLVEPTSTNTNPVGADFTVPAFAVMFAFFQIGYLGYGFVTEHAWSTWPRVRASSLRSPEIAVGKVAPYFCVSVVQFLILFALGRVLFGMHLHGSSVALGLVVLATVSVVISFALVVVALLRSAAQITTVANLATIVLAAVGGALIPADRLPGWAQPVAPATPHYWAMDGFRCVIEEPCGVGDVAGSVAVLFTMALVLFAVALWRLRLDDVRFAEV